MRAAATLAALALAVLPQLALPSGLAAPADSTPPAPVTPGPAPDGAAHSWYVGDLDPARLQGLGAADARRAVTERLARSVTVLDLGDPAVVPGATDLPDHRGTSTVTQSRDAVVAFARGWAATPQAPPLVLVVGTSNYGTHVDPAHGTAWGHLVSDVAAAVPPSVDVRGGLDAEPGYGGPAATRAYARAFLGATQRPLVDFGDCGCEPGQAMTGGWTRADRAALAAAGSVLPQAYRTSGADARRWASLERDVQRTYGRTLEVLGVLTQARACVGPPARGCTGTDAAPARAVASFSSALGRPVPGSSDIGYLAPPPPPDSARPGNGPGVPAALLVLLALAGTAAVVVVWRTRGRRPGPPAPR